MHSAAPAPDAPPRGTAVALPGCYHCGLPVTQPGRHVVGILGAERELCCAGCEAVARTILAAGFERYYAARPSAPEADAAAGPAASAAELLPAAVYDDPGAQREFVAAPGEHERVATLILDRIRCAACLWLSEEWLRRTPGVLRADINYTTRRAQVAWDARRLKFSQIIDALRAIGYDAYPYDPRREDALARREQRRALWRLFVAGFGALQVMMYALPAYLDAGAAELTPAAEQLMRWASLLLTLPVMLFSTRPFFQAAWWSLRRGEIGLDVPISLGLAGGFAASVWATVTAQGAVYFDSICMLVFLLLGARYFEQRARRRAAGSLDHLSRWMPDYALRLRDPDDDASAERTPVHGLAVGDSVLVPPGARIPADGRVVRGRSSADESLLTGESVPLAKEEGSPLVGGTVNLEQPLVMRVLRTGAETQAAAIARLVERAAATRPRMVERADRVARALTAVVLLVAAGALVAWWPLGPGHAIWVAVAVVVATCPCALALAAPIVLTRASAYLLARGMALTRARTLETLERATDVVLDKTGTLTTGRFALARVEPLGREDEATCRAWAHALEAPSRHPIAAALAGKAPAPRVEAWLNFPGHGVEGRIAGRRMRIGARRFCEETMAGGGRPVDAPDEPGRTPVWLADEAGWLARFLLEDELRPEARELVRGLERRGLRVHLLSGDAPAAVVAVAQRLGIAEHSACAAPQDKFDYVARLQAERRVVAMVGDGLNDAPVLARADASFAMGCGADAAQAQADFVLLGRASGVRLALVEESFGVARRAMSLIRQNLAWALAYNAVVLPLAASGRIGPWEAALGMSASSFIVVLNAMRALRGVRTAAGAAQPGATEPLARST